MIDVKLLLRENVAGLGRRGDIVEVSPGYARNFLEPRGLAIKATAGGAAQAEAMRRSQSIKDAKDRESAEEIAKVLVSRTINVKARSAAGGKLFGSVTNVEIARDRRAGQRRTGSQDDPSRRAHQDHGFAPGADPSPRRRGVPGHRRGHRFVTRSAHRTSCPVLLHRPRSVRRSGPVARSTLNLGVL